MARASTAYVFSELLPQLIEMDALLLPDELNFDVPCIPKAVMEKALWYVEHRETHMHIVHHRATDTYSYYIMKKDSKYRKIETRLIEMYENACDGEKDRRVRDLDHLFEICDLLHLVRDADEKWGCPGGEGNPAKLICVGCKGFKQTGICSHVVAVNHILKKLDVRRELRKEGKKNSKQVGIQAARAPPALTRVRVTEPDSSDEEAERLARLGEQGK